LCSATASRKVMGADPMNLRYGPYAILVARAAASPGRVTVGYRDYADGPMAEVEALRESIVTSALGLA
jgi:hypothetical protein